MFCIFRYKDILSDIRPVPLNDNLSLSMFYVYLPGHKTKEGIALLYNMNRCNNVVLLFEYVLYLIIHLYS